MQLYTRRHLHLRQLLNACTPKKQFNGEFKYSEIEYSRIHGGKCSKLSVTSRGEDQTKIKLCKPGPDHVRVKMFSTLLHNKQLFSLFANVLLLFKAHCHVVQVFTVRTSPAASCSRHKIPTGKKPLFLTAYFRS